MGKKSKAAKYPFVSVCTPTFNRRPFIPFIIKCFENQTYPRDRMEWIIVDDGTDKIEDLVAHLPYVKYFRFEEKISLGKKRNFTNDKATGEIIVYMDDDDYYPPDRVKHAVDSLMGSKALVAGSSAMFIYFKHINKMYKFGPYGPNHATAATFAFKKELLKITRFNEDACLAEEKKFLKDYTIPFVQLDPKKCILVFSHNQNTFDKKELLKNLPNPNIHETDVLPKDIVSEPEMLKFFMEDIDVSLENYSPGSVDNKPDVKKQLAEIMKNRDQMVQEHARKQAEYRETMSRLGMLPNAGNQPEQQAILIQNLINENNKLREEVTFLKSKIKQMIDTQIEKMKAEKKIELSSVNGGIGPNIIDITK